MTTFADLALDIIISRNLIGYRVLVRSKIRLRAILPLFCRSIMLPKRSRTKRVVGTISKLDEHFTPLGRISLKNCQTQPVSIQPKFQWCLSRSNLLWMIHSVLVVL
uniref:Uncharacterized protein n=1 Tax=Sphaerodactylus townsendi TaxID=933632 RepID=A0ACB8E8P4_9SAUR